jgi:hypothetical protein
LSRRARQAGLRIKPFVSADTIRTAYGNLSAHPWAGTCSGRYNGTLFFWDELIEDFRFPFLKTALARQADRWRVSIPHMRDVIEQGTSYPYRLIESNVERFGISQSASRERHVRGDQRPR